MNENTNVATDAADNAKNNLIGVEPKELEQSAIKLNELYQNAQQIRIMRRDDGFVFKNPKNETVVPTDEELFMVEVFFNTNKVMNEDGSK